jgi:hypothetical protein
MPHHHGLLWEIAYTVWLFASPWLTIWAVVTAALTADTIKSWLGGKT